MAGLFALVGYRMVFDWFLRRMFGVAWLRDLGWCGFCMYGFACLHVVSGCSWILRWALLIYCGG